MYAATKGFLDKVSTGDITSAETAILEHVDPNIYKVGPRRRPHTPAWR